MRQQFVRVYLGMLLVFSLAALALFLITLGEFESAVDRRTERTLTPLVLLVRERIAEVADEPEELTRVLESINGISPIPVHFAQRYEAFLPEADIQLMRQGRIVVVRNPGARSVYAAAPGGRILHVGPVPFNGGARSIYWVLLPLLLMLVAMGATIYLLIRPLERRIFSLANVAKRFGTGDLKSRATVGTGGTLDELETSFNWMAGRIEHLVTGQKELLRAVSHDLRTPLARLFFVLDGAQSAQTIEEKDQMLARIDRSLIELNDLVDELLTYLRLDENKHPFDRCPTALAPVFGHAAELADDLRPDVELGIDCEIQTVHADARYFKRALSNLVVNALAHAKKHVRVRCSRGNDAVEVSIEDDGPGIEPDQREKIFEPFFRLDTSRGSDQGGTGLGLAIVDRIMKRHAGSVRVTQSELGGACFILVFPTQDEE